MVEAEQLDERTLAEFTGFTFVPTNPYNYGEAKRLLRLALDELRKNDGLVRELRIEAEATGRCCDTCWRFTRVA